MSKYTTELRFICENLSGLSESDGASSVDEIIEKAREKIFSFNYDIFSASYKKILETKIIKHFYLREIAFETYGIFKLKLETKMQEIMTFYNELYLSDSLITEPLSDFKRIHGSNRNDSSFTNESSKNTIVSTTKDESIVNSANVINSNDIANLSSTKKNRYSETPQGGLDGIESNEYLTNASIDDDTSTNTTTSNSNAMNNEIATKYINSNSATNNYKELSNKLTSVFNEIESGNNTSQSELLLKYRETFINIDMMVINELEELFLQIW